ncbi:hypothetical protein D3C80_1766140 [compost metagenome]
MLKIDCINIFDQLQHLRRRQIIGHPAAELCRNVEFTVTVSSRSPKTGSNRTGRQTACEFLTPRSGRTQLDFLLQDRAVAAVYVMALVHKQYLQIRRFTRQFITSEYSGRTGTNDNHIIFTHLFSVPPRKKRS